MTAYYNENDPVAAEWLRNLIARDLIAPGVVDERDIRDVAPVELVRFTQCHFFAGIGIWSLALRSAGWPDDRPVWTGSCPCQPFSGAGKGEGFDDERHLWPYWHWLIQHVRPDVVIGEQVAGKDGLGWYDLVSDDLAGLGYTSGAVALSAAGFGLDWRGSAESEWLERALCLCPDPLVKRHLAAFADWADSSLGFGGFHIRERIYVVGMADAEGGRGGPGLRSQESAGSGRSVSSDHGADGGLDDVLGDRRRSGRDRDHGRDERQQPDAAEPALGLVDRERAGLERQRGDGDRRDEPGRLDPESDRPATAAGPDGGVADEQSGGRGKRGDEAQPGTGGHPDGGGDTSGRMADRDGEGRGRVGAPHDEAGRVESRDDDDGRGQVGELADADGRDPGAEREQRGREYGLGTANGGAAWARDRWLRSRERAGRTGETDGRWRDADWLLCRDGQWRPAEPGTFPLADAAPGRVGQLRAYGNGLDFETATEFCGVVRELMDERESS